jgi:DNA-binding MarR family transcriptional regulator
MLLDRFGQFSSTMFGVWRDIQRIERDEMEKFGYKGAYAQYLVLLSRHLDGLIASRICELCAKDKAAVSRILSEMQANGLVRRDNDEERVYRGRVRLTEEGERVAAYICEQACAAVTAVDKTMTEEERNLFYGTLERISAVLQGLAKDGISK